MKKIKVLVISHSAYISGAVHCLFSLCKFIDKDRFELVVVLPFSGQLANDLLDLGIKTYTSQLDWWVRPLECRNPIDPDIFCRINNIVDIIEHEKPDIIHTNTSVIVEGAIAAKIKNIPHVWHLHENLNGHPSLEPLVSLQTIYEITNFLSDKIVVVSNELNIEISKFIMLNDIETVANGVDENSFVDKKKFEIRNKYSIEDNCFVGAVVGALDRGKGYDILIDAISFTKNKGTGKTKYFLVGDGSAERVASIKQKILNLGLESEIIYLGPSNDVATILCNSDFFVLPSLKEAFPVVILEAMASGLPVIATDCGGVKEMVKNGENGFIVPVNDAYALASAIDNLVAEKNIMDKMGHVSRQIFLKNFTIDKYVNAIERIYLQILQNGYRLNNYDTTCHILQGLLMKVFEQYNEIFSLEKVLQYRNKEIELMVNSRSWKLTAPLRKASRKFN